MRALVWTGDRQVELREVAAPRPGACDALVRVAMAGICGADVAGYLRSSARRQPPAVPGHEAAGIVTQLPPGEWACAPGDRVVIDPVRVCGACRACQAGRTNLCPHLRVAGEVGAPGLLADEVAVPADRLCPIGAATPDARIVLAEPLANAVHLLSETAASGRSIVGCAVAIWGCGLQGAFLLQLARMQGARRVAVVEPVAARREIAHALGAHEVFEPGDDGGVSAIQDWCGPAGPDVCIDAAGLRAARAAAIAAVRPGGAVRLLGLRDPGGDIDWSSVVRRELHVSGSFAFTRRDLAEAIRLLEAGAVSVERWTRVLPMDAGPAAFALAATAPGDALKVAVAM